MEFISECLRVNGQGHLAVGGADVVALAKQYGTPLYIMDENQIRNTCRALRCAMQEYYGKNFLLAYASKAFCTAAIYKIMNEEGMGADVVSGGELFTAIKAGFPTDKIYFHGNNKTAGEIEYGLQSGVRRFVVDNLEELELLNETALRLNLTADISFRIKPGIEAHTHEFVQTGKIDSKFGVALETGEAMQIIKYARTLKGVRIKGVHCHIGSQIFELEPFKLAVAVMMRFISDVKNELGQDIPELNLGGGFGIKYIKSNDPPSPADVARTIAEAVKESCEQLNMQPPFIVLEPGRSIVAPAGITVYTVGSVKEIPGIRTYVSVDGGMTDNPRYALYGAVYELLLPERPLDKKDTMVTVAGRCCESGDLVASDVRLPKTRAGELLAVLSTGAYNYSMASNYNRVPRPAVIMVADGTPKLIVRRETYEDLIRLDVL